MKLKNNTEIVFKYLVLCSSLVSNVYAAIPFSSGSHGSDGSLPSALGRGSTYFDSEYGSRELNTDFTLTKSNGPSDFSNTPVISIADGKNALRAEVTVPASITKIESKKPFLHTKVKFSPFGNSAENLQVSKQHPSNPFYKSETVKHTLSDPKLP